MIICILCIYAFAASFGRCAFFTKCFFFFYFIQAGTAMYLVNVFICHFLDHIRNSTITGTVLVLKCHIFLISIFTSFYLLILLYSFTDIFLSVGTVISVRQDVFLLLSLTAISSYFIIFFHWYIIIYSHCYISQMGCFSFIILNCNIYLFYYILSLIHYYIVSMTYQSEEMFFFYYP